MTLTYRLSLYEGYPREEDITSGTPAEAIDQLVDSVF
jgi:hypothetical protein